MIPTFPKIFTLGSKPTKDIFDGPVEITEKIDGSQLSFGMVDGELKIRSKGKEIIIDAPDSMFKEGVEFVQSIKHELPNDTIFHGEYLKKPKHNTLTYNNIPKNHFMLFGIRYLPDLFEDNWTTLSLDAEKFGFDVVPLLFEGIVFADGISLFLGKESILGGPNVEGIVIKNYGQEVMVGEQYFPFIMAKFVSEAFKEKHQGEWKKSSIKGSLELLIESLCSEARWKKAVQSLRDSDELAWEAKDIGKLIKYVQKDVIEEEKEEIKEALWNINQRHIVSRIIRGLPEWYKEQLIKDTFDCKL